MKLGCYCDGLCTRSLLLRIDTVAAHPGAPRCYGRLCLAFHPRSTNRDEQTPRARISFFLSQLASQPCPLPFPSPFLLSFQFSSFLPSSFWISLSFILYTSYSHCTIPMYTLSTTPNRLILSRVHLECLKNPNEKKMYSQKFKINQWKYLKKKTPDWFQKLDIQPNRRIWI